MADADKTDEGKKEAKSPDGGVAQPTTAAPEQPTPQADAGKPKDDPKPPEPILVRLIAESFLKPFEEQTLAIARGNLDISRRTYRIAVFGFLAAVIAAIFVGVQVKVISYQTQIMGAQSESAAGGAAIGEMNTRKQLSIAQQQADAAQESVKAIQAQLRLSQKQWRDERRPWLGLKDDIHVEKTPFTPDNAYVSWAITTSVWNYGLFPATRIITTIDTGKSIAFRIHGAWKNTENCRNAAQLSRSSPDYYPNASGLFPATSLPFSDTRPVETDSNYLAICIAYTDATNRPYSTKLLYVRQGATFRLLDADIQ
jgi:hypothetical protein